jgi:hypothetical protein
MGEIGSSAPRPDAAGDLRAFAGMEIVEPGIVRAGSWRARDAKEPSADLEILAAVGRKLGCRSHTVDRRAAR